jgi:ATP-dependent DNA helicase RecQ
MAKRRVAKTQGDEIPLAPDAPNNGPPTRGFPRQRHPASGAATSARALKRTMQRVFGVDAFRPGQEDVVRSVLNGRDTLAIMPTGGGKSLCYQLPGLHLHGTTVVVSPLISLMKDQTDKLATMGIAVSQVNSALPAREATSSIERIRNRAAEFVLTTPERLADPSFTATLARNHIDFVVVDEAHCVSQWGHDFRPAFLAIKDVITELGHPPVLALTATATPDVTTDIVAALGLRDPAVINTGVYRPNLQLQVLRTPSDDEKRLQLVELLRDTDGSGIVYAASIKQVESVHAELEAMGFSARPYHGRLAAGVRRQNQEAFMAGEVRAMVATNAFGMGIDKPDIRFVAHYSLPGSLEAYYQEAGRAGRDGAPARCVLLFQLEDRRIHRYFIGSKHRGAKTRLLRKEMDAAEREAQLRACDARRASDEEKLERMMLYGQSAACRWRLLLEYFAADEIVNQPDFRCGTCDNCVHPPELDIAPPTSLRPAVQ